MITQTENSVCVVKFSANSKCQFEWFHFSCFSCVYILEVPKRKWFCTDCKFIEQEHPYFSCNVVLWKLHFIMGVAL